MSEEKGRRSRSRLTRRGSRGAPSKEAKSEERNGFVAAHYEECFHCGNPEIDCEGHCEECGFTPNFSNKESS